jgi:penicillin-binding protein 2
MDRNTGAILAMVSNPTYDPNLFDYTNPNSQDLAAVIGNEDNPMYDRADQGQYPLGSVFKIITMSAALETGVYTAKSTYNCGYYFTDPSGLVLSDWTLEYNVPPSGLLTLPQGLMRSCDPFFYSIGQTLYDQGYTTAVSDLARAFGLGQKTGFELTNEQPGSIPDPANASDAVQLAIGQGTTMVTPLQVADFVAAVGNGGTLYRPQIVDKIVAPDGTITQQFTPAANGTLPVSADNLKIVQDAMVSVVANPKGTAYFVMANMSIPVAGKTGTAQTSNGDPDAWFAGYSMENNPDKPDIAVAVLLENAGEGSEMAAPIFRRAVSLYFSDDTNYGMVMPWEASPYIVASPTPNVTDTPTEVPSPTDTDTPAP